MHLRPFEKPFTSLQTLIEIPYILPVLYACVQAKKYAAGKPRFLFFYHFHSSFLKIKVCNQFDDVYKIFLRNFLFGVGEIGVQFLLVILVIFFVCCAVSLLSFFGHYVSTLLALRLGRKKKPPHSATTESKINVFIFFYSQP